MAGITRGARIVVRRIFLLLGLLALGVASYAQGVELGGFAGSEEVGASQLAQRSERSELDRRIGYIWMFAEGVEWSKRTRRPITIELIGVDASFAQTLSAYSRPRRIGRRRVRVVRTQDFSVDARRDALPNIVYVGKGAVERLESVYAYFRGKPVLVISEQPYFGDGWMVSFPNDTHEQTNVKWVFSYNPQNIAKLAKLRLKGRLKDDSQGDTPRRTRRSQVAQGSSSKAGRRRAGSSSIAADKGATQQKPGLIVESKQPENVQGHNGGDEIYSLWRQRMGIAQGRLQSEDWGLAARMDWRNELLFEQAEIISRKNDTISFLSREMEVLLHEVFAKSREVSDSGMLLGLYPKGLLARPAVLLDKEGNATYERYEGSYSKARELVSEGIVRRRAAQRMRANARSSHVREEVWKFSTAPWLYEVEGQLILMSLVLVSLVSVYFVSLRVRRLPHEPVLAAGPGAPVVAAGALGLLAREEKEREEQEAASRLLADISHEMRTPLNAIVGLSEYLGEASEASKAPTEAEAGEVSEALRLIRSNAETLNRTMNNVMTLNMIQGGTIRLEPKEFSVEAMFERINGRMRRVAEEVGVDVPIAYELRGDIPPRIFADEGKISAVLELSLSSALFSSAVESLTFGCERMPEGSEEEFCFFAQHLGQGSDPADDAGSDRTFSRETARQLARIMGSEIRQLRVEDGLRCEFSVRGVA